jgi:hypothetical protein
MSRKLKRVLHAVEEKQHGVWRVIKVCDTKKSAEAFQFVHPGRRQTAVYERNEDTLRPGKCLWVVESRPMSSLLSWNVHGVYLTLLIARATISRLMRPAVGGLAHETRLLRFVRRKQRGW